MGEVGQGLIRDDVVLGVIASFGLLTATAGVVFGVPRRVAGVVSALSHADVARRRDAKLFNEKTKLFATYMNSVGSALFITVGVAPILQPHGTFVWWKLLLGLITSYVLHRIGRNRLNSWKSED